MNDVKATAMIRIEAMAGKYRLFIFHFSPYFSTRPMIMSPVGMECAQAAHII